MKNLRAMLRLIKGKVRPSWIIALILNSFQTFIVSLVFGYTFMIALDSVALGNLVGHQLALTIMVFGGVYLIFVLPIIGYVMETSMSSYKFYIMNKAFEHYIRFCEMKEHKHSAIAINYIQTDVKTASNIFGWSTAVFFQAVLSGIGSILIMFFYSYQVALMCLSFGVAIFFLNNFMRKKIRIKVETRRTLWTKIFERIVDIVSNHRIFKVYNLKRYEYNKIEALSTEQERETSSIDNISNKMKTFEFLLSDLCMYFGTILIGLYFINIGEITFGTLMLFLQLNICIVFLFSAIGDYFVNQQEIFNASERLADFFQKYAPDSTPLKSRDTLNVENWKKEHILALKCHITEFRYQTAPVLRNVYFELRTGETYRIVGENGAGKSTIAKLLTNQYNLINGEITLNKISLNEIPQRDIPSLIALLPQNIDFIKGSIIENIELGFQDYESDFLDYLLSITELDKMIDKMPQGLETIIEAKGNNLSSGQKQRIALVRSMIRKPLVLILDELDASIEHSLYRQILLEIRKTFPKLGLICINHGEDVFSNVKTITLDRISDVASHIS